METKAALLSVSHLSKSYPGLPVLHDVSFDVAAGEIVCLLGPSGCGKTTLLRIVAGLESPDSGRLEFAGQDLTRLPVHERHFGLMFQDFALFPHKNVFDNVAFGLRMQHRPAGEIAQRVRELLALVRLAGYERRQVTELSGGEQQRVALARSLAPGPRLLMLDEPLGSLDRTLREQVMNELREIIKQVGVTALYVTHDQSEAFAVADRIFVMRPDPALGGHVEQAGTPQEVYRQPATPFVARFLGFHNLLPGKIVERTVLETGSSADPPVATGRAGTLDAPARGGKMPKSAGCLVETPLGLLCAGTADCPPGQAITVLVRPEAAQLRPSGTTGSNVITGTVREASFRGSYYLVNTSHGQDLDLLSEIQPTGQPLPAAGQPVTLWLDPAAITLLPQD